MLNKRIGWLVAGVGIIVGVVAIWLLLPSRGSLHQARSNHGAVRLPSGQVLVIGGSSNPAPILDGDGALAGWLINHGGDWLYFLWVVRSQSLTSCELYDPRTHLWSQTASLHLARDISLPVLLPNGAVLEVGGHSETAELYAGGHWVETGPFPNSQTFQNVSLLNGQVLAVSNCREVGPDNRLLPAPCALYHPESNSWTRAESAYTEGFFALTALGNGKVLTAGGSTTDDAGRANCELYNNATWKPAQDLLEPRSSFKLITLCDGRALAVGGIGKDANPLKECELFDPKSETWKRTGDLTFSRAWSDAVRLQNGQVLVIDGCEPPDEGACELYDPQTGTWTQTGRLREPRYEFTATVLQDGQVLVAGGMHGQTCLASCELYDPKTGHWTRN